MFRMLIRYFKEYIGYYRTSRVDMIINRSIQAKIDPNLFKDFVEEMQKLQVPPVHMAATHKPRFTSSDGVMTDLVTGEVL